MKGKTLMKDFKSGITEWILAAGLMVVLSPACFAQTAGKGMLQNFEPDNGTEGEYFTQIWNCTAEFDAEKVHAGSRSIKMETLDKGGTVGIKSVGNQGQVDLTKAKKITLWVYDTQGDNTVELRFKDANGNGGSGPDGKSLWSTGKSRQNAWTKIEWNPADYPQVDGLDLSKISSIEVYELQAGVFYFDDLEVE